MFLWWCFCGDVLVNSTFVAQSNTLVVQSSTLSTTGAVLCFCTGVFVQSSTGVVVVV